MPEVFTVPNATIHDRMRSRILLQEAKVRSQRKPLEVSSAFNNLHIFAQVIASRYPNVAMESRKKLQEFVHKALKKAGTTEIKRNDNSPYPHHVLKIGGKVKSTYGIVRGHTHALEEVS